MPAVALADVDTREQLAAARTRAAEEDRDMQEWEQYAERSNSAVDNEFQRQVLELEAGRTIAMETRLWDADKKESRSMRGKEQAHDYRYLPDPDLPMLVVTEAEIARVRKAMPELRTRGARATRTRSGSGGRRRPARGRSGARGVLRAAVHAAPKLAKQFANGR